MSIFDYKKSFQNEKIRAPRARIFIIIVYCEDISSIIFAIALSLACTVMRSATALRAAVAFSTA